MSTSDSPIVGFAGQASLAPAVRCAAEVVTGDAVRRRRRREGVVDLVDAQVRELRELAGEVGAVPRAVLPPRRAERAGCAQHLGDALVGVRRDRHVGHLQVQAGRRAIFHRIDPTARGGPARSDGRGAVR